MGKNVKTNAMRILDKMKVPYVVHEWDQLGKLSQTNLPVYKTLVTEGKSKEHYVFVIPVDKVLDLKAAARSVGEKSVAMIKEKELLPLTGYVHGGCSPIGMKKQFTTVFDESILKLDEILFSGGKVGISLAVKPSELPKALTYTTATISIEKE